MTAVITTLPVCSSASLLTALLSHTSRGIYLTRSLTTIASTARTVLVLFLFGASFDAGPHRVTPMMIMIERGDEEAAIQIMHLMGMPYLFNKNRLGRTAFGAAAYYHRLRWMQAAIDYVEGYEREQEQQQRCEMRPEKKEDGCMSEAHPTTAPTTTSMMSTTTTTTILFELLNTASRYGHTPLSDTLQREPKGMISDVCAELILLMLDHGGDPMLAQTLNDPNMQRRMPARVLQRREEVLAALHPPTPPPRWSSFPPPPPASSSTESDKGRPMKKVGSGDRRSCSVS